MSEVLPKFRFKKDNNNFLFVSLKDISSRITRVNDGNNHSIMMITSQNGFVPQSSKYSRFMAGESLNNYTLLKKGELAYNKGSSKIAKYGCVFEMHDDSALIPHVYHSFSINPDNDTKFYALYLNSGKVNRQLKRLITSSVRMDGLMNISYDNFVSIKVPHPSLEEQKKIAEFLSKVDEKIALQSKKVEGLEKLKLGFIQKIFSRELRFKDENGKVFGAWEEKKISDISSCFAGGTPDTKKGEYWENGTIPWMSSGEIHKKRVYDVESRITKLGYKNSSAKMTPVNSVLVALAGQGKTRGTVAITKIELCTNQSIGIIVCNNSILADYLYHNLDSRYEELRRLSSGDGLRGGLNLRLIKSIKVPVPPLLEQKKIAEFLFKLDDKIEIEAQILERWKKVKKGLLQQMFV